jgi:hypothetical protein
MNDTNPHRSPRSLRLLGLCVAGLFGLTAVGADASATAPKTSAPNVHETPEVIERPGESGSDKSVLSGAVTWTRVSGDTGKYTKVVGGENEYQAAYSIRWWESSDDPCKFEVYTRHLNNPDNFKSPDRSFCKGSPGDEKWAERRGKNEYITAIQVCLTDKKDSTRNKVKGVRLWGRTLDVKAAKLGPQNGPDESRHTNCKTWSKKASCPAGQVATKVKVYFEKYTQGPWEHDYGFAKGIALGCREIAQK